MARKTVKAKSKKTIEQKPRITLASIIYWLTFAFVLFLPTQLGKHFFMSFSYLSGVRIDYLAPTLYLTDIIVAALAILNHKIILKYIRRTEVIVLCLLFFINALFALSPEVAAYRFVKILELYFVYIVIKSSLLTKADLLWAFLLGGYVELVLAVWQLIENHSIQGLFYFLGERYMTLSTPDIAKATMNSAEFLRPYGTFSHPNSLAGFYLALYIFVLTDPRFKAYRYLKYGFLFVSSALILISFSKAAIFSFLILNVIFLLRNKDLTCNMCRYGRIIILTVLSSIFIYSHGDPFSISKRFDLTIDALAIFFSAPLTGVGLGNYVVAQLRFPIKQPYFFLQPVHNIFLLFITEAGLILGGFIIYYIYRFLKPRIRLEPVVYVVAAIALTGMLDHYWLTLQQNWLLLPLIFALL
ncbi:MAG: hypothetical protein RI947_1466 [Candidatus Parcubacteria bacterium]